MPPADIEIVPNLLTRSIPSAHAAIGNANASSARTNTRLICISSRYFVATACPHPTGGAAKAQVAYSPQCIYSSKVLKLIVPNCFNNLRALFSRNCKRRLKFSAHLQHRTSILLESVGELTTLRHSPREPVSRTLGRLEKPNRCVPHPSKNPATDKWLFRATCHPSKVAFR